MIRERRNTGRRAVSLFISIALHVGFALALAVIPKDTKQGYSLVKMEITQPDPAPEPEPVPEPEPEPEPEVEPAPQPKPKKQKPKRNPSPDPPKEKTIPDEPPAPLAPPEPEPEAEPEKTPEAPPVFDLGNNSFAAGKGQEAAWALNRSEGNTKFAPIQKPGTKSSRGTQATGNKNGTPGGTGKGDNRPVPFKNLSKRPEPRNGPIKLPPYPPDAKREGIEGLVVLQVYIDSTGRVRKVRVVKDPGGGLGTVARKAMMKEVWTPPRNKTGAPVDTVIIYRYRFVLES